jgi:uncharacterized membrane protein YphA (DoxX/SURF4 family)
MTTDGSHPRDKTSQAANQPYARIRLALVRLTIGAMFVWIFFKNLGEGLSNPGGYAGLVKYYIQQGHAPATWKAVMALAAPLQALTDVLLVLGLLTRQVGLVVSAFLTSLWISEWGTAWIWELLVPVLASLALTVGRTGRLLGVDAILARGLTSASWWST